jgi:hypothetical protein
MISSITVGVVEEEGTEEGWYAENFPMVSARLQSASPCFSKGISAHPAIRATEGYLLENIDRTRFYGDAEWRVGVLQSCFFFIPWLHHRES